MSAAEFRARIRGGQARWQASLLTPPGIDVELQLTLHKAAALAQPCMRRCGSCSVCIRASWVARHGGDHPGGPVEWESKGVGWTG
jgi:hypothetical protein